MLLWSEVSGVVVGGSVGGLQDGDLVAAVVVDVGVTGESGGNEGLEREGAEKVAEKHVFKRVWVLQGCNEWTTNR